jgi:hypothetical protein
MEETIQRRIQGGGAHQACGPPLGRIQDFKLGGGALKKIAPSGGRREHFWSISCEKSRFYTKKSNFFHVWREARKSLGYFVWKITILRQKIIFFPIAEGGAKIFGVFRVKNHDFTPKNHIFSNCRGRRENSGVFRVKNHDFTPKNNIFFQF